MNFILETVWTNTFVEESTLTRAITILRKQLGDDSRAPTYIETVPTLGYRFISKVETSSLTERLAAQADEKSHSERPVVPAVKPLIPEMEQVDGGSSQTYETTEGGDLLATDSSPRGQHRHSSKSSYWILLLVLLLAVGGSLAWWRLHSRPVREEKKAS